MQMQVTGSQVIINIIHKICFIKKNAFDQMTQYLKRDSLKFCYHAKKINLHGRLCNLMI